MENNQVQIFENPEFGKMRTLMIDGEPWASGKDVATALGYANPTKAIRDHVDPEDKTGSDSFAVNGTKLTLINESGLYSLILGSKLPKAKEFKRWVTSEVLPTLRKTGSYGKKPAPADPSALADLVRATSQLMRDQRKNVHDIAYAAAVIMHQYGVDVPAEFLATQGEREYTFRRETDEMLRSVREYKPLLPWS